MPETAPRSSTPVELPAFNLVPNLVVDLMGCIAIVRRVQRDAISEVATVTLDHACGETIVPLDYNCVVRVLGVTVDLIPDNIELFNS